MPSVAYHWCCCVYRTLATSWPAHSGNFGTLNGNAANIYHEFGIGIRFIYWRICCFVCTREPKRRRSRRSEFQRSLSQPPRIASARPSIRRSVRVSQRTADSGIDSYCEPHLGHAYSDTELRFQPVTIQTLSPRFNVSICSVLQVRGEWTWQFRIKTAFGVQSKFTIQSTSKPGSIPAGTTHRWTGS